jgi:hypothetical protein
MVSGKPELRLAIGKVIKPTRVGVENGVVRDKLCLRLARRAFHRYLPKQPQHVLLSEEVLETSTLHLVRDMKVMGEAGQNSFGSPCKRFLRERLAVPP